MALEVLYKCNLSSVQRVQQGYTTGLLLCPGAEAHLQRCVLLLTAAKPLVHLGPQAVH